MKLTTIKKWKRDALELQFDYATDVNPSSTLIRKLAAQVATLAHALEQEVIPLPYKEAPKS